MDCWQSLRPTSVHSSAVAQSDTAGTGSESVALAVAFEAQATEPEPFPFLGAASTEILSFVSP